MSPDRFRGLGFPFLLNPKLSSETPVLLSFSYPPAGPTDSGRRIAIVGCGPRGLFCLASLCRHLESEPATRRPSVHVFEATSRCGAGNVYDPDQPSYLRMNFAAGYINAWSPAEAGMPDRLSLVDWLAEYSDHPTGPEDYVPRGLVGEYLQDCFRRVQQRLLPLVELYQHQAHVTSVERDHKQWRLKTSNDQSFFADDVVISVGHEGWRTSAWSPDRQSLKPRPVFPVSDCLSESQIPARSTVAIRGFGLTSMDAMLSLTEGRGGQFQRCGQRLSYVASNAEPAAIVPYSRSGRPMLSKPIRSKISAPAIVAAIWEEGRRELASLSMPIDDMQFRQKLWPIITSTADDALAKCLNAESPFSKVNTAESFEAWISTCPDSDLCYDLMLKSVEVAYGRREVDERWALGEAWRQLYPVLVQKISHGGLAEDAWYSFHRVASEMERIAFGPPAENINRLLALVDCGLVDLNFVTADLEDGQLCSRAARNRDHCVTVTHVINAVIPSPTEAAPSGPVRHLLESRLVHRLHNRLGVRVDSQGCPSDGENRIQDTLAIMGRATEGCILGNDSLNRRLHQQPDLWAEAAANRCRVHIPTTHLTATR